MKTQFTKMHGLGNDFMVLDTIRQDAHLTPEDIKALSNRYTGIGFDQCLIIEPSNQEEVDFIYRIFNANGAEVGQCGNGARCLARYVQFYQLTTKKRITIATNTTRMQLQINDDDTVTVNMGYPKLKPEEIPFQSNQIQTTYPIETNDGKTFEMYLLNIGNPHAVILVPNVQKAKVDEIGSFISTHPLFPEQVNVGFMEIINSHSIKLRVFERGCGETLACGSGAVAAAAIGQLYLNLAPTIIASLPGGELKINWEDRQGPIYLTGPATFVYEGILL